MKKLVWFAFLVGKPIHLFHVPAGWARSVKDASIWDINTGSI